MTSEVFQWVQLFFDTVLRLASVASSLLTMWLVYRLAKMFLGTLNPVLNRGGRPQGKYLMRRLFCSHKHGVARIRDPYGRQYTACVRCGEDVNQGKAREEWR